MNCGNEFIYLGVFHKGFDSFFNGFHTSNKSIFGHLLNGLINDDKTWSEPLNKIKMFYTGRIGYKYQKSTNPFSFRVSFVSIFI
jgi:hypothetical protein